MDDQKNQKHKGHKVEQVEKGESKSKQQGKGESQTKNRTFSTSSPSHEFSFLSKSPPSISALDLSPADEIFFHGHLLPLRLLSHLPHSPRSPIRSLDIDTFSLPIKEEEKGNITSTSGDNFPKRERVKSKSFSFFVKRRKLSFNMSHVIKRYMRVIRPLLFIKGKRENMELRRKPYSFSGYFSSIKKREAREGGGAFSAPVSRSISPRNSSKLATNGSISSTKSDSTMEELQAAIQAAIAHCKNSIAMDEKVRS